VTVSYTDTITDGRRDEWLPERPDLNAQPPEAEDSEVKVEWVRGIIVPTDLGQRFARAVGVVGCWLTVRLGRSHFVARLNSGVKCQPKWRDHEYGKWKNRRKHKYH